MTPAGEEWFKNNGRAQAPSEEHPDQTTRFGHPADIGRAKRRKTTGKSKSTTPSNADLIL